MTIDAARAARAAWETGRGTQQIVQNGKRKEMKPEYNDKAKDSGSEKVHSFVGGAYGAYRLTQWPGKLLTAAGETAILAGAPIAATRMKGVASVFSKAADGMIISYTAWAAFEIKDQFQELKKDPTLANSIEMIRRCLDWATAACYTALQFAPGVKQLANLATSTDFTVDVIESGQAATKWSNVNEMLASQKGNLSEQVQNDLASEKKFHLIAMAKSTISATLNAFKLLGIILGATLLLPIVFAVGALVTCTLAIIKSFYKTNMVSKPLSDWEITPRNP